MWFLYREYISGLGSTLFLPFPGFFICMLFRPVFPADLLRPRNAHGERRCGEGTFGGSVAAEGERQVRRETDVRGMAEDQSGRIRCRSLAFKGIQIHKLFVAQVKVDVSHLSCRWIILRCTPLLGTDL